MTPDTIELMNRGMKCLTDELGIVKAEQFIAFINREKFDYTKWQRDYFDKKDTQTISNEAQKYEQEHPYTGKAEQL